MNNSGIYYKVIIELKSKNEEIRNRGIAKAVLIKDYSNYGEFESRIAQALWEQIKGNGFPEGNFLYVWGWEDLPHPNDIEFNELYYNYLKSPTFNRSVNGGVIAKNNSTESSVNEYIQLFRRVSAFGNKSASNLGLSWEPEYFLNTVKYIYEYIDNEKSVLNYKMSLFGMGEEGEKRFVMLGDFIAMLSAQAHFSNVYTDDVKAAVNNVIKLLNEIGISTISLELTDKVIAGDLTERDIKHLMNRIIVGSRDELRQVMNSLDILLILEANSISNVKVSSHLVDVINSLKYFEAGRSSSVIYQLIFLIDHPLLTIETYRNIVIEAFRENLDKLDLSLNESDRDLIESIYSLSMLARRYYDSLIRDGISISDKFVSIIEELSQAKLKEVRYMWEDILSK